MSVTLNFTGLRITDVLAGALSGSDLAAYNAAAVDALVPISSTGFAAIAAMSGTTTAGLTNSAITGAVLVGLTAGNLVWQNTTAAATNTAYSAGYAVAFRTRGDASRTIAAGTQIGYCTSATGAGGTAFQVTSAAAATTTNASGYAHYVVKRPSVLIPSGSAVRAFLGNMSPSNYSYINTTNNSNFGGAATITGTTTATFQAYLTMQVVQLPTKQW
jgi:hypothetical protein